MYIKIKNVLLEWEYWGKKIYARKYSDGSYLQFSRGDNTYIEISFDDDKGVFFYDLIQAMVIRKEYLERDYIDFNELILTYDPWLTYDGARKKQSELELALPPKKKWLNF